MQSMNGERLVIVGAVAAGTKAASRARRVDSELDVVVYAEEPDTSISECGLPYFLSGTIGPREVLVARTPSQFAEKSIDVRVRHRVESFDAGERTLVVRDLSTGDVFRDSYDRLVIATGARAVRPPVPGVDLDGVSPLRFLSDADGILAHIEEYAPRTATVVGGGYIGLEVAENLHRVGMQVRVVEAAERVAGSYGHEVSERIRDHLESKGVEVLLGRPVGEFVGEDRIRAVRLEDGTELATEIVVLGVGVEPSVELAREAGAELGKTGAIRTDAHMRTSLPDVWAAGDCVETTNLVSGEPAWVPLGDTANQMGRVAGTNAAVGAEVLRFPGVLGSGIFKVFDLGVGRTGLTREAAEDAGFEVESAGLEATDRAGYFPGVNRVYLELVAERSSGRLLGAEAAGPGADKLTDVCATALWGRLTVTDLVNIDLAYAPPYGPALSPVIQAATVLSGKLS